MALFVAGVVLAPATALAQLALPMTPVPARSVRVDGQLRDWPSARMISVGAGADASMRFVLGYDATGLWIAAAVQDDRLVRRAGVEPEQDAIIVTLALPAARGGAELRVSEVWVLAGVSGRSPSRVALASDGARPRELSGARVVEATRAGGYDVEAFVPWSAIAGGATWRDGRGAVRLRDVDQEARFAVESEPATAVVGRAGPSSLPPLAPATGERATLAAFLATQELENTRPRFDLRGDVAGDARPERVFVVDRFVVVTGEGYRNGEAYSFHGLPADGAGDVREARLADLTGDRTQEIVLRLRQRNTLGARDLWEVLSVDAEGIRPAFAIELRKETSAGFVEATLAIGRARTGAPPITVSVGRAQGLDAQTLREAAPTDVEPMVLPWGPVLERTYRWDGTRFARASERANPAFVAPGQRPAAAAAAPDAGPPAPPPLPGTDALVDAFRRERGIAPGTRPRFDRTGNVAEDRRPERVLVFGSSLVIVGAGFRGGRGYFYFGLPVPAPDDLLDASLADVTGDGVAEVLLRVRQTVGDVRREILLVQRFQGEAFGRAASVEVAREQGSSRIDNEIRTTGGALEVRGGRARGWTAQSYPFADQPGSSTDAILLPWRNEIARYRLTGGRLVRTAGR